MPRMQTFFWHDYETTGADPRRDRPLQFAGIRTDGELNIVGEPVMFYGKPPRDVLPHPEACLITGITPQHAERAGLIEAEFTARVHEQLGEPGTCGVGYNSLRFDDEFTRHLLYRNFYDPYAREWENGNSRWDLIDLVRMCQALRPAGIRWPRRDDGTPSFKLEHLALENHLQQERAHDALSDVHALIDLARLIRTRQPRLWNWHFALRRKQQVFNLIDLQNMTPLVHVSSRYPAARHCLAVIAPLAMHPTRPGEIIVYDLGTDPADLLALDEDDIADRVFTSQADLPENVARIPLRTVRSNRSPALAPLSVLRGTDHARFSLDLARCLDHRQQLRRARGLTDKLQRLFARSTDLPPAADPELALYDGFLPDADKRLLAQVRSTPPARLAEQPLAFRDTRYAELLFRYRARNWPETLSAAEADRWETFCDNRLHRSGPLGELTLTRYFECIASLRTAPLAEGKQAILDHLQAWGEQLSHAQLVDS